MTFPGTSRSQEASQRPGPDFFCVGAQKGGTGWLYEQLREHSDFWMPPMKELHYFDRLNQGAENPAQRSLPYARNETGRIDVARARARDDHDRRFLEEIETLFARPSLDLDRYARLFNQKGGRLSGDITPGYSILSDEMVATVTARFPNANITFIARDPVERAWSQLSMFVRRGLIGSFDPNDEEQVRQHLLRPEVEARSYPSRIVALWRRHVQPERLQVFFFDDLKNQPADLRQAIIRFLGGDPTKPSGRLPPDYNAKAQKGKLALPDRMRSYLGRFFEAELKTCALELGGAAQSWPARYGF